MLLRRDAAYVTSAILPIRNVNLTLLPIDRIVLILKAELFLRTTGRDFRIPAEYHEPHTLLGRPANLERLQSPRLAATKRSGRPSGISFAFLLSPFAFGTQTLPSLRNDSLISVSFD